jgi:hypothetical protein
MLGYDLEALGLGKTGDGGALRERGVALPAERGSP